jgi:large subunit ribosomal protein L10
MLVPVASFTRGLAALAAKKAEGETPAAAAEPVAEVTEAAAE